MQPTPLEEHESEDSNVEYDRSPQIRVDQLPYPSLSRMRVPQIADHSPRIHTYSKSTPTERSPLVINFPKVDNSPTGSDELNMAHDEANPTPLPTQLKALNARESFIPQAVFRPLFPARSPALPYNASPSVVHLTAPTPRWTSSHPQLAPPLPAVYAAFTPPPSWAPTSNRTVGQPIPVGEPPNPPNSNQPANFNRSLDSIPSRTRGARHLLFGSDNQVQGFMDNNKDNLKNRNSDLHKAVFYSPRSDFSWYEGASVFNFLSFASFHAWMTAGVLIVGKAKLDQTKRNNAFCQWQEY